MKQEIPKVYFKEDESLLIEAMNFKELTYKLSQPAKHNPFAVHKINFYLILVVTKGVYTHYVDFNSYQLKKGSAIFIAKNQVHHFTKDLEKAEGFCMVISSPFLDKSLFLSDKLKLNRLFNYHIETPVIHQVELGGDELVDTMSQLYKEYNSPSTFAKSEIMNTLLHLLLLKAERAKETQSISGVKIEWLDIFSSFKDSLERNYTKTRSSRAYASELIISYKFLNDVVKQLTGKTVKAFIDDFVIMEIKRYLVSTALSIKEVSYKTGFEEPANMVRFFKKHTQVTPLKFRQAL